MTYLEELRSRLFASGPIPYGDFRVTSGELDLTDEYSWAIVRRADVCVLALDTSKLLRDVTRQELVLWLRPAAVVPREDPQFHRPMFVWEVVFPPRGSATFRCGRGAQICIQKEQGDFDAGDDPICRKVTSGDDGAVVRVEWINLEDVGELLTRDLDAEVYSASHLVAYSDLQRAVEAHVSASATTSQTGSVDVVDLKPGERIANHD